MTPRRRKFYAEQSIGVLLGVKLKIPHKSLICKGLADIIVTTEGFEPSTLGAEIRYSIQLNYVAKCQNRMQK